MIINGASKTALFAQYNLKFITIRCAKRRSARARKRNPICAQAPQCGEFVKLYYCLPLSILQRGAKLLKITNFLIRRIELKSCEEVL